MRNDINDIVNSFKIDYANDQINISKDKVEIVVNSLKIDNDITKNTSDS